MNVIRTDYVEYSVQRKSNKLACNAVIYLVFLHSSVFRTPIVNVITLRAATDRLTENNRIGRNSRRQQMPFIHLL